MKQFDSAKIIQYYFPNLDQNQIHQFETLKDLYLDWNSKINVISRKDTENFYTRHVLHSLSIAKFIDFKKNTKILDVGTGGGFPGIPLAIYFKNTSFTLVDSIGKKIKVVDQIVEDLEIKNVKSKIERAENISEKFDFIVSRAVTQLERFCPWIEQNIAKSNKNEIQNGIIYLKGGDLKEEIQKVSKRYNVKIYFLCRYKIDLLSKKESSK
ncbi:MAG: 16S rRNA (guanine(527)-N(7))-methyltransferase RsmG [Flavobacteriales bacterium]|nr:16S rRNA (guanine(527)-N(7))-methyltransferase RsmG [Flavobacteriales bacterium]